MSGINHYLNAKFAIYMLRNYRLYQMIFFLSIAIEGMWQYFRYSTVAILETGGHIGMTWTPK